MIFSFTIDISMVIILELDEKFLYRHCKALAVNLIRWRLILLGVTVYSVLWLRLFFSSTLDNAKQGSGPEEYRGDFHPSVGGWGLIEGWLRVGGGDWPFGRGTRGLRRGLGAVALRPWGLGRGLEP